MTSVRTNWSAGGPRRDRRLYFSRVVLPPYHTHTHTTTTRSPPLTLVKTIIFYVFIILYIFILLYIVQHNGGVSCLIRKMYYSSAAVLINNSYIVVQRASTAANQTKLTFFLNSRGDPVFDQKFIGKHNTITYLRALWSPITWVTPRFADDPYQRYT